MLNQLLSEMDGFAANIGVILLSATNRPEVLDPALLRPGRFDSAKRRLRQRQIVVDRPDKSGRQAILVVHARNVKMSDDVNLLKLAARTPGFAGADLANLVNEAALLAARHDRVAVTMSDFEEAIERILTGLEKKSRVLNEIEKETVAYHEVGHAIVGSLMPGSGSSLFHRGFCPEKISIVPRGVAALGYTLQLPQEDRFLMVEDELRGQIAMLLGGRSADSARLRQREVKYLIDNAHRIAGAILAHNQPLLTEMAQVLLEREILVGQQLHDYLVGGASPLENRVNIPPLLATWLQTGEISIDPRMVEIGKSFNSQHLQEH